MSQRTTRATRLLGLGLLAGTLAALPAAAAETPKPKAAGNAAARCAALQKKTFGREVTVTKAAVEPAAGPSPEYCVAEVQFDDSALRFQMWLPTEGWNKKLAVLGGGGFDGVILGPLRGPLTSPSVLSERYAVLVTNGGYDAPGGPRSPTYFQASFAMDATKLADFTWQSEHRALPRGKDLVQAFYGAEPARSYYEGCSMGGHDAMLQSQRFPNDYDGIVAGAPAGNVMGLFAQFSRLANAVSVPGASLNPAKQKLLAQAVLQQCDALDGIADGLLSRPGACDFKPATLRCADGKAGGDGCLTDPEIATVELITSPYQTRDGTISHPGFNFGGEDQAKGWGEYIWPVEALGGMSIQGAFATGFVRSFVTRDPAYDTKRFNADEWAAPLNLIGSMFQAFDPDLTRYHAHGGKLVLWNGTQDTSISPRDTQQYYQAVVGKLGQANADQTVELFLKPGVGHCFGGTGADQVDLFKAMTVWVEQGTPPSRQKLVALRKD